MDITKYRKKPLVASGVKFDGTLPSATDLKNWVESGSGLSAVLQPVGAGAYRLYIPTPSGTFSLEAGGVLLQTGPNTYYPITAEDLATNYDEIGPDDAQPV